MVNWQDFDFDGKIRIPWGFNLMLIYLLRGYITWIVSLTYRKDPSLLLSLIYTETKLFYLALLIGLPAFLVQILLALKKQKEKSWYQSLWLKSKWLLAFSLMIDIALQLHQIIQQGGVVHWFNMLMLFTGIYLFWYWLKSTKLNRFFASWLLAIEPIKKDKKTRV